MSQIGRTLHHPSPRRSTHHCRYETRFALLAHGPTSRYCRGHLRHSTRRIQTLRNRNRPIGRRGNQGRENTIIVRRGTTIRKLSQAHLIHVQGHPRPTGQIGRSGAQHANAAIHVARETTADRQGNHGHLRPARASIGNSLAQDRVGRQLFPIHFSREVRDVGRVGKGERGGATKVRRGRGGNADETDGGGGCGSTSIFCWQREWK
mmetsp:Transcript_30039/g.63338  ORF Transcript_30039/g.63338 Transcript_30039/m.63338 type:complete len:206 (-) Transcript_30039:2253-2870(-)